MFVIWQNAVASASVYIHDNIHGDVTFHPHTSTVTTDQGIEYDVIIPSGTLINISSSSGDQWIIEGIVCTLADRLSWRPSCVHLIYFSLMSLDNFMHLIYSLSMLRLLHALKTAHQITIFLWCKNNKLKFLVLNSSDANVKRLNIKRWSLNMHED